MTSITATDVEKCKRILENIEARDTYGMGYEAKLRHNERMKETRRAYERALAAETTVPTAQSAETTRA